MVTPFFGKAQIYWGFTRLTLNFLSLNMHKYSNNNISIIERKEVKVCVIFLNIIFSSILKENVKLY